uniref:Uncharacterized protein n=1 Tax=Romanomermis culicivorax TaxID=13658 RepID=A0A915HY89_ROMCU
MRRCQCNAMWRVRGPETHIVWQIRGFTGQSWFKMQCSTSQPGGSEYRASSDNQQWLTGCGGLDQHRGPRRQ